MQTIKEPNEKVSAIINTKHPESEGLRLSLWAVPFSEGGVNLMKHTFSGEILRLTDEEFADPLRVPGLAERRFTVPADYNEAEKYSETLGLINLMHRESPGLSTYTILPTLACNARCTYCYEEGYAVSTMSQETAERLVDYICETRQDDEIKLSWFGGEPLVCAKTISYICSSLKKRGVPFRSQVISNGSLFTPELISEAKEVWNLKFIQVSLDGDRRDYTERKRYIDPERFTYDLVMRNIRLLAEADIRVNLRVNYDRINLARMRPFLNEMKAEFGNEKNVTLYLAPLYQEKKAPDFFEVEKNRLELDHYIHKLGLIYENREKQQTKFRLNMCMADGLSKSVVIDPNGTLYNCEHLSAASTWGNIFDGVTDPELFEKLSAPHPIDERCRCCPFLPQCTPFYIHGCPGWFESCREFLTLRTEYELRRIAEKLANE